MINVDVVTDTSLALEQSTIQIQFDANINQVIHVASPSILLEFPIGSGGTGSVGDQGPIGDKGPTGDQGPAASFDTLTSTSTSLSISTREPAPDEVAVGISISAPSANNLSSEGVVGGFVQIRSGNGAFGGEGGEIRILTGSGDTGARGGPFLFQSGNGSVGGNFDMRGGSGIDLGGEFGLIAGDASGSFGFGGSVTIVAGSGLDPDVSFGGSVNIVSGAGTNPGSVSISSPQGQGLTVGSDGTSTTIGFFGSSPTIQPTLSTTTPSTTVINNGVTINTNTEFDGWTLPKLITALRNLGLIQ